MTLIFTMPQGACRCCFCQHRMPICHNWMSTTNRNINYPRCKARNCWRSVNAYFKNKAVTLLLVCSAIKLPRSPLSITATKSLVNYRTYKTINRRRAIDTHCNVLSIQHLLLSIIVFSMIWLYCLSFCLIETQPCGKAKRCNHFALFALTQLRMLYHTKRFSVPAIYLFMKRYSEGTSYHLPIIFL